MRVLLCHQPTDGGVGRHVRDLIEGLVARGHEVVVCAPALPHGLQQPVAHVHIDLTRAVAPGADTSALVRLARVVRDLRPEVIHAHSSKAGAIARLARPLLGHTPVLYTPHGYAFAGYFSRSLERLAYLGGTPTTKPEPIFVGATLREMLERDVADEEGALVLYRAILAKAGDEDDIVTQQLFRSILADEEEHHDTFSSLLEGM